MTIEFIPVAMRFWGIRRMRVDNWLIDPHDVLAIDDKAETSG